jgi:3-hydroxyisobutyrate dehydrogenase-like beta-hydroxyacid dehydrogenase
MAEKIGFIGLGTMGVPMARNLVKAQHKLCVHDVVRDGVDALVGEGAVAAASPAAVAESCDTVMTMLPDSPHVREVLFGEQGLCAAGRSDLFLINSTTMSPRSCQEIAAEARERGVTLLEAPVTRGIRGAIAGTLCFFVGGDKADLERARPLLEVMGSDIHHIGGHGDAMALKMVNNALSVSTCSLVAEAVAMGGKWGLDPQKMLEILSGSSGDSYALQEKLPRIIAGDDAPGFAIKHGYKDLSLALQLASELGTALPVIASAREVYGMARLKGKGELDTSAVFQLYTEDGG